MAENKYWVVVSNIFYFHPYLGKIPNLTNIFQRGWNHQLEYIVIWGEISLLWYAMVIPKQLDQAIATGESCKTCKTPTRMEWNNPYKWPKINR